MIIIGLALLLLATMLRPFIPLVRKGRTDKCRPLLRHRPHADPSSLHPLLLQDPAGVYPRMTSSSRQCLQLQALRIAHHLGCTGDAALHAALQLSRQAEVKSLEAYVGYYFQDADGLLHLRRALGTRRGWFCAHTALRSAWRRYALLLLCGCAAGFLFLQARHPVFMLPAFALCAGDILRRWIRPDAYVQHPALEIGGIPDDMRTLVVLHAVIGTPQDAIAAMQRLHFIRQKFTEENVDLLLLGEFAPYAAAVAPEDDAILYAACTALSALRDKHCLYLHRPRSWNANQGCFSAPDGLPGGLQMLCRLIVQGDCEEPISCASVPLTHFERRYAYVLLPDEQLSSTPVMLARLLGIMSHPMHTRYPLGDKWRGFSVLSPERTPLFHGAGLLRPADWLESAAFVQAAPGMEPLLGELAGHAAAGFAGPPPEDYVTWDAIYQNARLQVRFFRWQLPWVDTPKGMIANPLGFLSRFRLREELRRLLLPGARFLLLLWAMLTHSWLLIPLALCAGERFPRPFTLQGMLEQLARLSLLPTEASIRLWSIPAALHPRVPQYPDWYLTEIWVQSISAAVMGALGVAFPALRLPALILATLFVCFPWAHRLSGR